MSQVFNAMVRVGRERAGKVAAVALAGVAVMAVAPAAALARAEIQRGPTISGTAQVGQTLRAEGAQWSGGDASWYWLRCTGPNPSDRDCDTIPGATATTYKVQSADRGLVLRVLLFVCQSGRNGCRSSAYAISPQTAKVTDPPPPPPPPPAPHPQPSPSPSPSPSPQPSPQPGPQTPSTPTGGAPAPIAQGSPQTPATGGVLGETVRPALMMSPTPLVRIRGVMTSNGVKITLLTVRAPKGAHITLRCRGRSCPAKRWANTAAIVRVMKFERSLRAGTRLTITVTKPGRIGKHTLIVIRKNKMPKRSDRCLYPGARKPVACPAT